MLTLGEELLLVALDAHKGVLRDPAMMRIGLNAAGMAELVVAGAIKLWRPNGRPGVTVVEDGATAIAEHRLLAEVLRQARETPRRDRRPERALKKWRAPSLSDYLSSLHRQELVAWDRPKAPAADYGRFRILDTEAVASAWAHIEWVSTGAWPSDRDMDFTGIALGLGLYTCVPKGSVLGQQRFAKLLARAVPKPPGR